LWVKAIIKIKTWVGCIMNHLERILIKLIIIQFVFLIAAQMIFHQLNAFPELKEITQYEGVGSNQYSDVLETLGR
jgi:hypothetical protein